MGSEAALEGFWGEVLEEGTSMIAGLVATALDGLCATCSAGLQMMMRRQKLAETLVKSRPDTTLAEKQNDLAHIKYSLHPACSNFETVSFLTPGILSSRPLPSSSPAASAEEDVTLG